MLQQAQLHDRIAAAAALGAAVAAAAAAVVHPRLPLLLDRGQLLRLFVQRARVQLRWGGLRIIAIPNLAVRV